MIDGLRKWRLLILATEYRGHRYFYSWYRKLEMEGLCYWQFGAAHLTNAGYKYLVENSYLKHKKG